MPVKVIITITENKMKFITGLIVLILSFNALSNEDVDCVGHSNISMVTNSKLISVQAMYVINLSRKHNGYISQSGEVQSGKRSYKIDRLYKIEVLPVGGAKEIFEFRINGMTRHEPDSVPVDLPDNLLLNRQGIYKIQRTLVTSYLISDVYSPVLVCHMRLKLR